MSVEILLYIYLFVCAGMIVFNIVTAFVLRRNDKKTVKISEDFLYRVKMQLDYVKRGKEVENSHKKYLRKKLKRVGNMIAFDQMLESVYSENPATVKKYLTQLDGVFIALTADYCDRNSIEAAYLPYIIKKYRIIAYRPFPSIVGTLLKLLYEPSIYCRENAMQALYTTGDADCIIKAIKIIDSSDFFFHDKLLSDGLLNFAGNASKLNNKIVEMFDEFSDTMKVTLLNYLRFSTGEYRQFALKLLCDENAGDEVRYACIRYLGKYHFDEAFGVICKFADSRQMKKWEYAALASTAIASYPSKETIEILKNNLYSQNWYVRYNSSESLERLGLTYADLADVIDGNDRYAAEILRYRLEHTDDERSALLC